VEGEGYPKKGTARGKELVHRKGGKRHPNVEEDPLKRSSKSEKTPHPQGGTTRAGKGVPRAQWGRTKGREG